MVKQNAMSIEVYNVMDKKTRLFFITEELYDLLDRAVLKEYNRKTGLFIDNYGNSRLSAQHSKLLLELLKGEVMNKKERDSVRVKEFVSFLQRAVGEEMDLYLIGD